jgi:hypothetical protein
MSAASLPRYLLDQKLRLVLLAGLVLLAIAGLLGSGAHLGSEIHAIAQDEGRSVTPFRWS